MLNSNKLTQSCRGKITQGILSRDDHKCKLCRATDKLLAHHIDGNPFNNDPMNMITLCGDCHGTCHLKHGRAELNAKLIRLIEL